MESVSELLKGAEVPPFEGWISNPKKLAVEEPGRICVVANREPYLHVRESGEVRLMTPASGLVTALEPIARLSRGLWIGHGSGSADRETADARGVLSVPPGEDLYKLKRVWLTEEEEQGYYYGFANEGIWPLCHIVHARPIFRYSDWMLYQKANKKFADAFEEEVTDPRPLVLIQDYHFACLPALIRNRRPDAAISLFWHIPWNGPDITRICPWKNELLEGMLGADVLAFQTQYHCNNFLECVDRFLEARVDRENFSVTRQGHVTYIKPIPISIEWPTRHEVPAETIPAIRADVLRELGLAKRTKLAVGVDRIDYTKGILERFQAVKALLTAHPELVGKFCLLQIGAPSRTHIPRYRQLTEEVVALASQINESYPSSPVPPIQLKLRHHGPEEVFRYYRAADVCVVNSLHDGMNLVAKEFIASRSDERGALVLSSFTGAARELTDAFIVNPYDIEATAEAIFTGLTAPPQVLRERMRSLRSTVASRTVFDWANELLEHTRKVADRQRPIFAEAINRYGTA